jgi:hypothetical protein
MNKNTNGGRAVPSRHLTTPPFGACSFLPITSASHVQTPCNLRPWLTIVTFNSIFCVCVCVPFPHDEWWGVRLWRGQIWSAHISRPHLPTKANTTRSQMLRMSSKINRETKCMRSRDPLSARWEGRPVPTSRKFSDCKRHPSLGRY